jgi:hypothetical protein
MVSNRELLTWTFLLITMMLLGYVGVNNTPFTAFALGILTGEIADFLYDRLNEHNIEGEIPLLHWLEHYHWGMILLFFYELPQSYFPFITLPMQEVAASPFFVGLGISLILDENRSDTKFAWEKEPDSIWYHFYESSVIGIMIGSMLIIRWFAVQPWMLIGSFIPVMIIGAVLLKWKLYKREIPRPLSTIK